MEQKDQKIITATPVVQPKIPVSLTVISYFFFTVGLLAAIMGFGGMVVAKTNFPLLPLIYLVFGVVYLFLSRGLRRCSRGWHICALIVTSCSLILTIYRTAQYILSPAFHGTSTFPYGFLLGQILALSFQVWILQVLTRGDIRYLVYGSRDHST
jgi:hypothetical protein